MQRFAGLRKFRSNSPQPPGGLLGAELALAGKGRLNDVRDSNTQPSAQTRVFVSMYCDAVEMMLVKAPLCFIVETMTHIKQFTTHKLFGRWR